jgi:hypothetical protein
LGCTNASANNYDSTATVDDGSCIYLGCTDVTADNFNPQANQDDGSCLYYGCTDVNAINFESSANFNDGSCMYLIASLFSAVTEGCDPLSITVINQTISYPESVCEFIFSTGDTIYDCSGSFDYTFNSPGIYNITYNYYYDGFPSSSSLNNIIVHPTPEPPVFVENNSTLTCSNCEIGFNYQWLLDGNNIANATNVTFNNGVGNNFLSGNFQLVVNSNFGCNAASESQLIIQPKFNLSDNNFCLNESAQININPISIPNLNCNIHWGDGITVAVNPGDALEYFYSNPGEYIIELTCYNNLDTGFYTRTVTVNDIPQTPLITYNDGLFTIENAEQNLDYVWENFQTTLPNSQDTMLTIINNGIYVNGWYSVNAINSFGCSVTSDSMYIAQPVFSISQDSICPYINLGFIDMTDIESDMNCLINWGDGFMDYIVPHYYINDGEYFITMTCNAFGQDFQWSDSVYVHIAPAPPIISYSIPNVQIDNFNDEQSYQWYLNSDGLSGQTNETCSILYNGIYYNGWYSVSTTNSKGCSTPSDSLAILQPFFTIPNPALCPGEVTSLMNFTQNWENTCEVNWGDGTSTIIDEIENTHIYQDSGTYTIELMCVNEYTSGSYSQTISTHPIPITPVISYSFGLLTCTNPNSEDTYNWFLNSQSLPNQTNTNLNTYFNGEYQNGWYSVSATNIFGCSQFSDSLPILQPFYSIVDTTVCPGDTTWVLNQTQFWDQSCIIQWGDGTSENIINELTYHVFVDTNSTEINLFCFNNYTEGNYQLWNHPNPIPNQPTFIYSQGELNCQNYNLVDDFQWYYNHNPINQATNASQYIFNGLNYDNGWYMISATNSYNCTVFSDSTFIIQPIFNVENSVVCSSDSIVIENITQDAISLNCILQWGDGNTELLNSNYAYYTHAYEWGSDYTLSLICSNEFNVGYFTDTIAIITSPDIPNLDYFLPHVLCTNCPSQLSFDWNLWGENIPNETNYNVDIWNGSTYSNGPYQLNVLASNGCTSSSDTIWVVQPYFILDNDSICQFDTLQLQHLTDGLEWLNCEVIWGDGINDNNISGTASHSYSTYGIQDIMIQCVSQNGLYQGTWEENAVIMETPQPILQENNNVLSCINGQSQWITHWEIDNIDQPQYNNTLSLSAELGVEYQITATTSFGCQGQSAITTDYVAPGIDEMMNTLHLYPNPTRDYLIIENIEANAKIIIYNSENKIVLNQLITAPTVRLNLVEWSSGLYTINIQNGSGTKTAQFLINQ